MSKTKQLDDLFSEYKERFQKEQIVLDEGNIDTRLMLVGEAPGKDEVRLSRPFVGAAGKNLNEFLNLLEIAREEIYIANAIKYRLSKINDKTGRIINRPATKEEIEMNRIFLQKEIEIIKPKYVVTLGNVPLRSVTGDYKVSIGTLHGQLNEIEILGLTCYLYPLYHPASIIYNTGLKEVYKNDLIKLKSILSE
jgi:DNA polymerase